MVVVTTETEDDDKAEDRVENNAEGIMVVTKPVEMPPITVRTVDTCGEGAILVVEPLSELLINDSLVETEGADDSANPEEKAEDKAITGVVDNPFVAVDTLSVVLSVVGMGADLDEVAEGAEAEVV